MAGPDKPPVLLAIANCLRLISIFIPVKVLISDNASAPPASAAFAITVISPAYASNPAFPVVFIAFADFIFSSISFPFVPSSANDAGTYYVEIDSSTNKNNLLESGGTSSWGNRDVKGYVRVVVSEGAKNVETDYYVALSDDIHGIKDVTGAGAVTSDKLSRGKVETKNVRFTDVAIPAGTTKCVEQ